MKVILACLILFHIKHNYNLQLTLKPTCTRLCMTKWLRKWREADVTFVQTQKSQSLIFRHCTLLVESDMRMHLTLIGWLTFMSTTSATSAPPPPTTTKAAAAATAAAAAATATTDGLFCVHFFAGGRDTFLFAPCVEQKELMVSLHKLGSEGSALFTWSKSSCVEQCQRTLASTKGRVMGPLFALFKGKCYCHMHNKFLFCVVKMISLWKMYYFYFFISFLIQVQNDAHLKKMTIFDLLFTFFSHQGQDTKISSAHISLTYIQVFCLPHWPYSPCQFCKHYDWCGSCRWWVLFAPFWGNQ